MSEDLIGRTYVKGQLYRLPIGDITLDPGQPRKYFDAEGLAELSRSIADKGVLQPILVCLNADAAIVLVAGERRLRAARDAGLNHIPAIFIDDCPEEIALIENSLRQDLTAIEEAEAVGRLAYDLNYGMDRLAKILGKKRQTINDILSLNRLPPEIKEECRTNKYCPRRVLVEIARKKQVRAMQTLYRKYKEKGLTSDELRSGRGTKRKRSRRGDAYLIVAGIGAVRSKLEKLDWVSLTDAERREIRDALCTMDHTFQCLVGSSDHRAAPVANGANAPVLMDVMPATVTAGEGMP